MIAFPPSKAAVSSYWAVLQNRTRLVTVEIDANPLAEDDPDEAEEAVFAAAGSEYGEWS